MGVDEERVAYVVHHEANCALSAFITLGLPVVTAFIALSKEANFAVAAVFAGGRRYHTFAIHACVFTVAEVIGAAICVVARGS